MTPYQQAKLIATVFIQIKKNENSGTISAKDIEESVAKAIAQIPQGLEKINSEELTAELQRDFTTIIDKPMTIQADDEENWKPWVAKSKEEIKWRFWERYRLHLLQNSNLPTPVVNAIDETTDQTLNNLTDPRQSGSWDRRGMVVGHVQAGKTTNYAGLICKAADAGYKVFIVLTGFHNNLRTQTQIRLEETFIGYDKTAAQQQGRQIPVGVGLLSSDPALLVDTITNRSETGDFNRQVANSFSIHPGGRPLVFVIKKNASVLKNLHQYLQHVAASRDGDGSNFIEDIPLLLIDDECDQGSVDTAKMDIDDGEPDSEHDPKTINGLIRKILKTFSQSAYVAYTATPFANIFIHSNAASKDYGEDLFPRSFITVMPAPSNYIGPSKVFGALDIEEDRRSAGLPIVRRIEDFAETMAEDEKRGWMPPKHKTTHIPIFKGEDQVPDSLKEAIFAYILGCAVRRLRGQGKKHCSMLVHVTRLTDVQDRVFNQIDRFMRDMKNIVLYGEEGSRDEFLSDLRHLWDRDFINTTRALSDHLCPLHHWTEIANEITAVVASIKVKQINGAAGDVLDYDRHKEDGLNAIAIGGDKLSRGLTLEGLTVSYFTRPSKMYDTLMQMGRWFGYRDGFLDVCRLYAPESLIEWFEHIADASEELRREFTLMRELGETPKTYGQRVRTHPVLMVTSQVKMRHTVKLQCSYQGAISETVVFDRSNTTVKGNFSAVEALLDHAQATGSLSRSPLYKLHAEAMPGKYLWKGIDPSAILEFLRAYKTPQDVRRVNTAILAEYIERQVQNGDLGSWSVLLAAKDPISAPIDRVSGLEVELIDSPSHPENTDDEDTTTASTHRISGLEVGLIKRSNHPEVRDGEDPSAYRIRRLVSPADEAWDLDEEKYGRARRLGKKEGLALPGGNEIRACRPKSEALLILYPLKHQMRTTPKGTDLPYIGFAISFPGNKGDTPVEYRVNTVYQESMDA